MNNPFHARAPTTSASASAITATIQRAWASAGLDTSTGPMQGVADTIERALQAAGLGGPAPADQPGMVVDVAARFVTDDVPDVAAPGRAVPASRAKPQARTQLHAQPQPQPQPQPGSFERHQFTSPAGSLAYKLYTPAGPAAGPRAVVVMLHGCTQSADDFAAGTQMNRLADQHGLLVVYPEQAAHANPSLCWNWFQPRDQQRGAGEPAVLAGIVQQVVQRHGGDARRVFVAGLSAGAAMAVTLGETYPDVFAAVGAHSGLPHGSAHDTASALAAMKGGRSGLPGQQRRPGAAAQARPQAGQAVPVIVFHGDRDHTVQQTNGDQIVQQALKAHTAQAGGAALQATTHTGVAPGGRRFSRTVHADAAGQPAIEHWTVQGAGHAWQGGHASGSYTDGTGPDASAEMVRFFLALPRAGAA